MSKYSEVVQYGPDDEDTIEHVKLETCRVAGCDNPAAYHDWCCPRCREEINSLGLEDVYPPDRFRGVI